MVQNLYIKKSSKNSNGQHWWFSVGICKYRLVYKSHDIVTVQVLSLVENLQDLLSSLNAVISTNESTQIITGHVIYNPAYTYKFQLKTTFKHFDQIL